MSRRALLRGGALVGAGVVGGGAVGGFAGPASASTSAAGRGPFHGDHQSGIVTGTQRQTRAWTALGAELVTGSSNTVPIYDNRNVVDTDAYADATGASTTDDSLEGSPAGGPDDWIGRALLT